MLGSHFNFFFTAVSIFPLLYFCCISTKFCDSERWALESVNLIINFPTYLSSYLFEPQFLEYLWNINIHKSASSKQFLHTLCVCVTNADFFVCKNTTIMEMSFKHFW